MLVSCIYKFCSTFSLILFNELQFVKLILFVCLFVLLLDFKYTNDSVLLVERDAYEDCDVHNPILKFNDGNTVFEFDNSGFVYFISGKTSHCQAGQKMIIRVMVQSAAHHPTASTPAPSVEGPSGGRDGGDGMITDSWGPSATNSSDMLSVTSCFLTMFMGVVVVLYLFMD